MKYLVIILSISSCIVSRMRLLAIFFLLFVFASLSAAQGRQPGFNLQAKKGGKKGPAPPPPPVVQEEEESYEDESESNGDWSYGESESAE